MPGKDKIFDELARIAPLIPTPFYWLDTNITIIGANEPSLESVGKLGNVDQIIGKSFPDFLPEEFARELVATTKLVIKTAKRITVEEHLFNVNGEEKYFETVKSPLFDDENNLIGVLCTAIEITDRKEKDKLKFEEQARRLEQQEQFRKISAQVAHDLGSPLAALQMVIPHCDTLPEHTRNVLNKSAIRIADIAENFLSQFKPEEEQTKAKRIKEPTLISAEILEVLTEKKYQYSKYAIEFISNISETGAFAFISIDSHGFKRMLSNLINNAVDAIDNNAGKVVVSLESANNHVEITVADNGKGMPEHIKEKLLNNIQVTAGKAEGYGIGYTQIRDIIAQNNGELYIESEIGKGTKIIVTFPQIATPEWMAEKIDLYQDDLVIILDDDEAIHDAWETRFEKVGPGIKRKHFKQGGDAISFINKLSKEARQKVFLLTDYELLRQDLNGLDVIAQTKINRSILVTSHHNDWEIRSKAKLMSTKIVPKPLASVIKISILEVNKLEHLNAQLLYDNVENSEDIVLLNIKSQIEQAKPPIFKYLEIVAPLFPAPIYWFDLESRFVGLNQPSVEAIGGNVDTDIIGKSVYEQGYPFEMADSIAKHNQKVIATGKVLSQEDVIRNQKTGKIRYFTAIRGPLYSENGEIIGLLGTSVEITAEKEAERLKVENAAHIARALEQQLKFREISAQVAHDLGSPLAALQMVIPHCDTLPEHTRNVLNKSAIRIADIAENFLSQFKPEEEQAQTKVIKEPTLISAEILEVLTEKKYQYSKYVIEFISNISETGAFAFINIDSRSFKRMLSNLINNAVDAMDHNAGKVIVSLDSTNNQVEITVADNGKGMPEHIKDKLLNNIQVTAGKAEGYGIGYTQVRDTIAQSNGSLYIESERGKGTKIIVTFPQTATPQWMAEKIDLYQDDLVIILDDDEAIHDAWETRFEKSAPTIRRKHFKQGRDAISFINKLGKEAKQKIFLLTDYELLRQNLNGLDVIGQTKINRSVLVTSHHNNLDIKDKAKLSSTKILPKPLASAIDINILHNEMNATLNNVKQHQVDLVILDDDVSLVDTLIRYIVPKDRQVDKYHKPQDMLNNLNSYPKQTRFLIDNQYEGEKITGLSVAAMLRDYGYSNLYLFTNEIFTRGQIPDYVKVIAKDDIDQISNLLE